MTKHGPWRSSAERGDNERGYPERDDDDELFETWGRRGIRGGQGRSDDEVEDDAKGAGALFVVVLAAIAMWALGYWLLRAGGIL